MRTLQQIRERSWEKSLIPDPESRLTYCSSISRTEKQRLSEGRKIGPKSQKASSLARIRNPLPSSPSLLFFLLVSGILHND